VARVWVSVSIARPDIGHAEHRRDNRRVTVRTVTAMAGTSIAAPGGRAWMKDFLNAAFYARSRRNRSVEDLRLAHGIVNTRWAQVGRRLGVRDLPAFHRAYGSARVRGLGRIDSESLREGATELLGDWFLEAWEDPERRAHGIAFETKAARREFDPGLRLRHGRLGMLTPPSAPPERQEWATYPPVPLPAPDAALRLLRDPARWPDIASAAGQFTAVRPGGLRGQTFEIELAITPLPRALVNTRGYVTCTDLRLRGAPLRRAVEAAGEHVEAAPEGAEPLAYVELTTHEGHFLGRAVSRLILFARGGSAYVRDVGSWDPLPPHLAIPYRAGGHRSQVAFWGPNDPEASMLAQLALVTG
jgi:hypothetical protein